MKPVSSKFIFAEFASEVAFTHYLMQLRETGFNQLQMHNFFTHLKHKTLNTDI